MLGLGRPSLRRAGRRGGVSARARAGALAAVLVLLAALLAVDGAMAQMAGDLDGDDDVDRDDVAAVLADLDQAVTPPDPRDLDGDGVVTVLDAGKVALLCTLPLCVPPTAQASDDALTVVNGGTNDVAVLTNDAGDAPLEVVSFGGSESDVGDFPADGTTVGSFAAPGGGTVDVTVTGGGTLTATSNGTVGTGDVTIAYRMRAGDGSTDLAAVTITFGAPPSAVDDTQASLGIGNEYATVVGASLNVAAGSGLLSNDSLGSPAGALARWGGGDASPAVDRSPGASVALAGGTLTVFADGAFELAAPTDFGVYTFDYVLESSIGSSGATVEIHVRDPAIATDDALAVTNGGTSNVEVLANDSGAPPLQAVSFGDSVATVGTFPADGVTVGSFPAPGGGTIDVTLAVSGSLTATANGTTGTGTVSIVYQLQAADGTTDEGGVTVTFGDAPTAIDDTLATLGAGNEYSTDVGVTLNVGAGTGLLNNDTLGTPAAPLVRWGGGAASPLVDRSPGTSRPFAGGTLTVHADGSFDLVNPTIPGVHPFAYVVENAIGSSQADVDIYVLDPPVALADSLDALVSVVNDYPAGTLFADNGSGDDQLGAPPAAIVSFGGGSVSVSVTDNAAGSTIPIPVIGGTLRVDADGAMVIDTPTATGTFTFEYRLENGVGTSDGLVTVSVMSP